MGRKAVNWSSFSDTEKRRWTWPQWFIKIVFNLRWRIINLNSVHFIALTLLCAAGTVFVVTITKAMPGPKTEPTPVVSSAVQTIKFVPVVPEIDAKTKLSVCMESFGDVTKLVNRRVVELEKELQRIVVALNKPNVPREERQRLVKSMVEFAQQTGLSYAFTNVIMDTKP